MGSDRARGTYDKTRQYRRVVPQQGRVVLEADLNEAYQILTEESRHHVLEIVGAFGVPRDPLTRSKGKGYAVTDPGDGDFSLGDGAIYVGGLRVEQDDYDLKFANQTEVLETSTLGQVFSPCEKGHRQALAVLYLREQEVSGTEDSALVDVALGGPDTAQRVRLARRVFLTRADGHARPFEEAIRHLREHGYEFDPAEMRLLRSGTLMVNASLEEARPSLSGPHAKRNYLGADNQLIRVQVSNTRRTILWGYDDASFLYRVDVDPNDKTVLTLRSMPVDAEHQPRHRQVVEVLEASTKLDPSGEDWMTAPFGLPFRLAAAFDPDSRTIQLEKPLPDDLCKTGGPLYVRVWENEQEFKPGMPVPLVNERRDPTGIEVTLAQPPFVRGDYWCFAVRPAEPTRVFPARYDKPQPPEGPREWLCPLARVDRETREVLDLRPSFDGLVREKDMIVVGPRDTEGGRTLQSILDAAVVLRRDPHAHVTIRLEPGVYTLREPLAIRPEHGDLTLEACHEGVVFRAADDCEAHAFHQGMVVLTKARNVTLRGLTFDLGWHRAWPGWFEAEELQRQSLSHELRVGVALRPLNCEDLRVVGCRFRFSEPPHEHPAFGVAVFAGGVCRRLELSNSSFTMPHEPRNLERREERFVYGFALVPARPGATDDATAFAPVLADASFCDNAFSGMTAAVMVRAEVGLVRFERNEVRGSEGGIWIFSLGPRSLLDWVIDRRYHRASLRVFVEDERLRRTASIAYLFRVESDWDVVPPMAEQAEDRVRQRKDFAGHHPMLSWLLGRLHRPEGADRRSRAAGDRFVLHIANNRIVSDAWRSGAALIVSNTDAESAGSVVVAANYFANASKLLPTGTVLVAGRAAVTGNIVVNEANERKEAHAFVLVPLIHEGKAEADMVAVTGNVFEGEVGLPDRRHGLAEWKSYNDVHE